MSKLNDWLSIEANQREVASIVKVQVMMNELNNHEVAIKGCNVFPITYSLVGTVSWMQEII